MPAGVEHLLRLFGIIMGVYCRSRPFNVSCRYLETILRLEVLEVESMLHRPWGFSVSCASVVLVVVVERLVRFFLSAAGVEHLM